MMAKNTHRTKNCLMRAFYDILICSPFLLGYLGCRLFHGLRERKILRPMFVLWVYLAPALGVFPVFYDLLLFGKPRKHEAFL